jgi:hypothetical protein
MIEALITIMKGMANKEPAKSSGAIAPVTAFVGWAMADATHISIELRNPDIGKPFWYVTAKQIVGKRKTGETLFEGSIQEFYDWYAPTNNEKGKQ